MESQSPVHFTTVLCPQSYQSPAQILITKFIISHLAGSLHVTSRGKIPEEEPQTHKCPRSLVSHLMIPSAQVSHLSSLHFPMFTPSLGHSPPAIPYLWKCRLFAVVPPSPGMSGREQLPHLPSDQPLLGLWNSDSASLNLIRFQVPSDFPGWLRCPSSVLF